MFDRYGAVATTVSAAISNRIASAANNSPKPNTLGVGVAIGAGAGAALFTATSSPVWIGAGVAIGAAIGAASELIEKTEPEDGTDD